MKANHVVAKFGSGFPADDQAKALMAFERLLHQLGHRDAEVFKETMPDDSKLRSLMTVEERSKL